MSVPRTASIGAACLLAMATLNAAPRPDASPSVATIAQAPPPLQAAVRRVWETSAEVQAARAELTAAQARAHAAGQPLYNPSLSLEAENADVDRRTAGISRPGD